MKFKDQRGRRETMRAFLFQPLAPRPIRELALGSTYVGGGYVGVEEAALSRA